MVEEEFVRILNRLGLTISQAKVYLALLELKKASGKITAKHSKMARQEVYRVLAELQEKGLVEKIIATPTEFRPIAVEDCLSILIESKKSEVSESLKKATSLLQKLKEKNLHAKAQFQEEASQFILIPEKAVIKRIRKKIENTHISLDAVTTLDRFKLWLFSFYEAGEKAAKKGVTFRLIINTPDDENLLTQIEKAVTKNPFFDFRYINSPKLVTIGICDKKEVFIAISATATIRESPILMSNNPSLLAIFQSYFETLWLTAKESNLKIPSPT